MFTVVIFESRDYEWFKFAFLFYLFVISYCCTIKMVAEGLESERIKAKSSGV